MSMTPAEAERVLAEYFKAELTHVEEAPSIIDFAKENYYIPETGRPIILSRHQRSILDYCLDPERDFTTIVYSTIKKSGKTAIAGLAGRYLGEFSGPKAEIYFVANDKEQAKDRAYESAKTSIELTPGYDKSKRVLPGQWKIIERQCVHEPSGSIMRAIASDYEGAAGGNPTATFWTELWAFSAERFKRLWDELTPVPTRKRSIRFVETYAGFTDESELLLDLYKLGMRGHRLSHSDIDWPFEDQPPIWVNPDARMFMYWDTDVVARRMPWQVGPRGEAYYREQLTSLRPDAFRRLHLNHWVSSTQTFIPEAWWVSCRGHVPDLVDNTPVVLGVDASVSGDCTAIVGVSRHTDPAKTETDVMIRFAEVWSPPHGGTIDYAAVEAAIRAACDRYNIVQISYDPYQLHGMMQKILREAIAWARPFSQAGDREKADKSLYDLIRDRHIVHADAFDKQYVINAAAHVTGVGGDSTGKIERMRIVKKGKDTPVDPVVALSMAASECKRLILT